MKGLAIDFVRAFLFSKAYNMEKEVFKPKIRITTLSENGCPMSDRLVDAYTEFNTGPKVQHNGPIRIEVILSNKEEIVTFKTYLDKLSGTLPIAQKTPGRGRPALGDKPLTESPREDILQEVQKMATEGKNQYDIIKYLRGLGFVFILTEDFLYHFPNFKFEKKDIGEPTPNKQYPDSYSWMVRCIRRAKNPKTDKFDPMIIFGFQIIKGQTKNVIPYLYKERKDRIRCIPGKKTISFSQAEFTKLPKYMLEEERIKFSTEQRQLLLNPEKKPSKSFMRWYPDVIFPNSIKDKMEEVINRLKPQK